MSVRKIAMYLPQFHPTPENDKWWGKGFTEWTNVMKASARFNGHYQPHIPADLGFYDLRLEETRLAQEQLAREYGIHGFCYYHYWFNGKRLLYEPLERKMLNPKENLPFMLCWANENWTRAWDGGEQQILIKQEYSEDDDRKHIRFLLKYFKDDRYIKVDGKPVFSFYKPDLFPNIKKTLIIFREEAAREGMELYLCWFERWIGWQGDGYEEIGFDAAVEFQPLSKSMKNFISSGKNKLEKKKQYYLLEKIKSIRSRILNKIISPKKDKQIEDQIIDYQRFVDFDLAFPHRDYKCYPGVCPMWDNSSRRVNQISTILQGSTPELFKKWYSQKLASFTPFSEEENFIFINAWNEWAEGNHMEPCEKWGKQYLEALI